ncbi:MAG TPA: right-handed parallel beta-helix repeat-containing protein [Thermoanaerobaculia bacterium]|nr:right-handed parallel beta-helix repeat-containing protein [Thermoanaerobaculia bacterium]
MPLRIRTVPSVLALTFLSVLPAGAQATRTWVSGVGDDANPCSRTAPCKTFAGTISKTAAGGEINVLDPGGFGGVTITKSISIISEKFEAGVLVTGTNAIIVNAGANDSVVLRGLDIEGLGSGLNGIRFLAGLSLTVEHCTINNFAQKGISMETSAKSRLIVTDTEIRNNANAVDGGGIFVRPAVSGGPIVSTVALDRVRLLRNTFGLRIEENVRATVRDSYAFNNTNDGFAAVGATLNPALFLARSISSFNSSAGLRSEGTATARISESSFTGNGTGLLSSGGGIILSFGTNDNDGNSTNGAPTAAVIPRQ